jgi:RimJ/RimL family protein N-acetyltransferase
MSVPQILTQRLLLRAWSAADAEPMEAINRDPEVTRWLNRPVDDETITGFHEALVEHWAAHGFGYYAVEHLGEPWPGRLIGFVGVAYPEFLPEIAHRPEIGWRLAADTWGRGLATEAAVAARTGLRPTVPGGRLISIIHPENTRSQALARRLGMAVEGTVYNGVIDRSVDVWSEVSEVRARGADL